jgi:hypothetical protein
MINRIKLLDTLLDNQDLSDDQLVSLIEKELASGIPYNHKLEDIRQACGVKELDRDISILSKDFARTSEHVNEVEKLFSKRELAFMFLLAHKRVAMANTKLKELDKLVRVISKLAFKK